MNKGQHCCYYLSYILCYFEEKNSEAVKLCQDPAELFDKTLIGKYMAFLSGTKKLRHI